MSSEARGDGQPDGLDDPPPESVDEDARDRIADERDRIADEREHEADERERNLDAWEQELLARASELSVDDPNAIALVEQAANDRARARARAERTEKRRMREQAAVAREIALSTEEQAQRRQRFSELDPRLALVFAGVSAELHSVRTVGEVRERIVEAALTMIDGCDGASITVLHDGEPQTRATTGPLAAAADSSQREIGEGPAHDALATTIVRAPHFPDPRWKRLGTRLQDRGVASAVCYRLVPQGGRWHSHPAALNLYARREGAFSQSAQQVGLLLAAFASIAMDTTLRVGALEFDRTNLLESSRLFARATGILSAQMHITLDEAGDALARTAHDLGTTRGHVAQQVIDTGSLPETAERKDAEG